MKKQCPNPLCGSINLTLVNLTGYTDLVCRDCGQTVAEDVYGTLALENAETTAWMFGQENAADHDFWFYECETCGPIELDDVYEAKAESRPGLHGPVFRCKRCAKVVLMPPAEPDEYHHDEPDGEDLAKDA